MKKILINFAHPAKAKSKNNAALRAYVEGMEGVTVNDLYASYPDFYIDVKREQALCMEHDIIIFQYPLYWYQAPSIVKEWLDLVLEHGWAYGSKGKALDGKLFMLALTGGGEESTYTPGGFNGHTIDEFMFPMKAMTKLCSMKWLPPFTVLGIHQGLDEGTLRHHASNYQVLIKALRDEMLDLSKVAHKKYINSDLNACFRRAD